MGGVHDHRAEAAGAAVVLAALLLAPAAEAQGWQPDGEGAYVQVPTPPDETFEPDPDGEVGPPGIDPVDDGPRDGALLFGMLGARPHVTWVDAPTDTQSVVAGHVGVRAHATGLDDDFIGRFDLEGFIGASTEGLEGEGKAHLGFGLATPIERLHHLFFRIGAGGHMLGNPVVDYQVADLPALELGYVHVGADGYVEVAPRVAMGVFAVHAGDGPEREPDPAPAVGGRLLAGGDDLWATADYELVTGDAPLHVAYLTACFARRFALCIDGRVASVPLEVNVPLGGGGGGAPSSRLTAISGGLSVGLGAAEQD